MQESSDQTISDNNIRTLVYFFGIQLDRRIAKLLEATPYQRIRASDSRVFIAATRGHKTISEIARHLHISRQSTQSSMSRLVKLGIVRLEQFPENRREKLVVVTQQGWQASALAVDQLRKIEQELASKIGDEAYVTLRSGLEKLVQETP